MAEDTDKTSKNFDSNYSSLQGKIKYTFNNTSILIKSLRIKKNNKDIAEECQTEILRININ